MAAPLRIGVVGAGGLGQHHVRILRDMPETELRGFAETNDARAEQIARDLGVTRAASLEALLADVDAVTIVVPTPAHHHVAMAALRQGKHVLIEKPIATTLAEADEMVAAAVANGCVLQTGHVERFNRAVRAALRASFSSMSKWAWLGLTFPSPCRWLTTALGGGRHRCLAISTCTVRKAYSSTHGRKL